VSKASQEIRRRQVEIDTARGVQPEVTAAMGRLLVGKANRSSALSDDEPLYDSVASDDDYYTIQDRGEAVVTGAVGGRGHSDTLETSAARSASAMSAASTLQRSKSLAAADREVQSSEFCVLKEQLDHSEKKVQALIASNDDMRSELAKLNSTVQLLVRDNKELQVSRQPCSQARVYV